MATRDTHTGVSFGTDQETRLILNSLTEFVEREVSPTDLDSYCKESNDLADFKRPRGYYSVEELPKTPSGKVKKFELRETLSPQAKRIE